MLVPLSKITGRMQQTYVFASRCCGSAAVSGDDSDASDAESRNGETIYPSDSGWRYSWPRRTTEE